MTQTPPRKQARCHAAVPGAEHPAHGAAPTGVGLLEAKELVSVIETMSYHSQEKQQTLRECGN